MNRAAILHQILGRNALRREARLPPLDVPAEYHRAVALAYWREVYDAHYEAVREEIVHHLMHKHGRDHRLSAGGRWLIEAMVSRELATRFGARSPQGALGYPAVDAALGDLRDDRSPT